ncbi:MAG: SDR family oxidoreductase, partial [Acidobacteria bacterium]|nr:SDR family oxidoreductase [Acidobacteriota bacterium]
RVFAPKVRVNAVAPGLITTRWLRDGLGDANYDALVARAEQQAVLHKVCDAEDVAALILNVITGPDLVTGQIIAIEGGALISAASLR